ncbi:MAG: RluA family pseudouridine synthase [bacterium]
MSPLVTRDIHYIVEDGEPPLRLDLYLVKRSLSLTRSQIQKLADSNRIFLNGKPARASQKVRPGDKIHLQMPSPEPLTAQAEEIPLKIIFQDAHIAVIDKPADLVVHSAAGHSRGTLVNALLHHLKDLSDVGGAVRPGIVHRLDKGTSGIMVIAKTNEAHFELSRQFHDRQIQKTYLTLAYGRFKSTEGTWISRLGRSLGNRKKISSKTRKGREAETHYRVLKSVEGINFVEVKPHTGRTHQIRVHLAEAGHPVVGDPLYGGKQWVQKLKSPLREAVGALDHQALHAWRLEFLHPKTKKKLSFEAEIPEDFRKVLDALNSGEKT